MNIEVIGCNHMGQAILAGNSGGNNYTVLYDNPSGGDGTITLNESSNNFERLGIYYFANNRNFQNYTECFNSGTSNNGVTLQIIYPDGKITSKFYFRCAYAHINDATISIERNNAYKITPDEISEDGLYIKIYKVFGIDRK